MIREVLVQAWLARMRAMVWNLRDFLDGPEMRDLRTHLSALDGDRLHEVLQDLVDEIRKAVMAEFPEIPVSITIAMRQPAAIDAATGALMAWLASQKLRSASKL